MFNVVTACPRRTLTFIPSSLDQPINFYCDARAKESKNSVFSDEQLSCLASAEVGCNNIRVRWAALRFYFYFFCLPLPNGTHCYVCQDKNECLSSKDGRPYSQVAGFKVPFSDFTQLLMGLMATDRSDQQPALRVVQWRV